MKNTINRREVLSLGCAAFVGVGSAFRQSSDTEPFVKGVAGKQRARITELGNEFRSKFKLPGVSLAMSYRGKLKLLACFGQADKEKKLAVKPMHQFRIASVSKPITSVAVLRLLEQKRLSLDDRVLAKGGVLAKFVPNGLADAQANRINQISIRHLLEHSCGGWTNKNGEAPMFARPALGMAHAELIAWTLKNVSLRTDPGTNYAYSNFGYCLLGRVIEAVTSQPYEKAVKSLVLDPVGARSTDVGGHRRSERRKNEVVYYGKSDPYGANMDVRRMDAHGGWISTATDLVRFAQRVDGYPKPTDILKKPTLKIMTTPSRGSYAMGWKTNASRNWWHTGSFNGGTSILARIHDGHCWAVLVNTRPGNRAYFAALDQFPWNVKQSVKEWGRHDLFGIA